MQSVVLVGVFYFSSKPYSVPNQKTHKKPKKELHRSVQAPTWVSEPLGSFFEALLAFSRLGLRVSRKYMLVTASRATRILWQRAPHCWAGPCDGGDLSTPDARTILEPTTMRGH